MIGFGIYAEKRHGRRIYFSDLQNAKRFTSEQEAKDWANRSITDFDIVPVVEEGWTRPTLAHVDNQWRIYSDSGVAFVALEKASAALVAACPGAGAKLRELDSEPF